MVQEFSTFLQANPWVVVLSAFVTLLPLARWVCKRQTDVVLWMSKDFKYTNEDVRVAAKSTSYYISIVLRNLEYSGFFAFISAVFFWFSSLFRVHSDSIGQTVAWLATTLVANVAILTTVAILIYTSYFSQAVGVVAREDAEKNQKK